MWENETKWKQKIIKLKLIFLKLTKYIINYKTDHLRDKIHNVVFL